MVLLNNLAVLNVNNANQHVRVPGGKFQVHYDALEELEKGQVTELPGHIPSYAFYPKELLQQIVSLYGLSIATGLADFPEEKSLNKKFPDIKTTSIKTVIDAWKGK